MIPSQFMDLNGKFDASRVEVSEAEIDAAIRLIEIDNRSRKTGHKSNLARARVRARWNIALGKAIGVYGIQYEEDVLTNLKKGARV